MTRSPSQATTRSEDESISHNFFTDGIVTSVASLFTDMVESFINDRERAQYASIAISGFYYQFVYRASKSSNIIRKTLTALCGLFEQTAVASRPSSPRNHEYITRYSEAVTELRTSSSDLTPDVVLIASILFANCEYLIGDVCSAVRHLQAGARILREQRDMADGTLSPVLSETLGTIFDVLDHTTIDVDASTPGSDYFETLSDHQFDNLDQANKDLLHLYAHTFALNKLWHSQPRYVTPARADFKQWSSCWRDRTACLENTLTTEDLPWLDLLHGQHCAIDSVIDGFRHPADQASYNAELQEDLVQRISYFLSTTMKIHKDVLRKEKPLDETVGLILPLFLVILQCTDASNCQTALTLLDRLHLVEGRWNSCCAYNVATSVLQSRQAMRFQSDHTSNSEDEGLPPAEITLVTASKSGTELDLTLSFPYLSMSLGQAQTNAIAGSFCIQEGWDEAAVCTLLTDGGYQGPVVASALLGCSCREDR